MTNTTQNQLLELIDKLNDQDNVNGILSATPLTTTYS